MSKNYRDFEARPVSGAIGAEIHGLDLSAPLADETVAEIRQALLEHLVLFFRGQQLDPPGFMAFGQRFGPLSRYPFVRGMDDFPDIVEVVKREDERINFGGIWHSDTTYLETPPFATLLYACELPPMGGDTLFANMYGAYESLSPGMQRLLEGRRAVNSANKSDAAATRLSRNTERPTDSHYEDNVAMHPIVRTHAETGRKALYVNRGHTVRIEGMTVEESKPLLDVLFAHQSRPELTCRFRWTPGIVAFWDNRAAQHYAMNDYHGHRRVMRRITLAGDRPR